MTALDTINRLKQKLELFAPALLFRSEAEARRLLKEFLDSQNILDHAVVFTPTLHAEVNIDLAVKFNEEQPDYFYIPISIDAHAERIKVVELILRDLDEDIEHAADKVMRVRLAIDLMREHLGDPNFVVRYSTVSSDSDE